MSYYLIFEKGWFNIAQLEWVEAQRYFIQVVVVSMNFQKFDFQLFKSLSGIAQESPKMRGSRLQGVLEESLQF